MWMYSTSSLWFRVKRKKILKIYLFFLFCRSEKTLAALEKKNGVLKRWKLESPAAANAYHHLKQKRKNEICVKLQYLSVERMFLLEMKKKYAGKFISLL